MSRTYRNRHNVPHAAIVRDGGELFFPCCQNKKAKRASYEDQCRCHPTWSQRERYRRRVYSTERKEYRKQHTRMYRARVRQAIHHQRWENFPRFRRTSGWLTW